MCIRDSSYTDAESLIDGRGFINSTNWNNILSVTGNNNPTVSRSTFAAGSRITGFFSHKFNWLDDFLGTTISLFYTGRSGQPFSYVYNNVISDISSGAGFDDLIFVPASPSDINLVDTDGSSAAEQWAALDNFIENDDYLSSRRGEFAEPNQSRTPFEHILDLKIAQDINIGGNQLQVTFDVFNFTNLISSSLGRRFFVGGGNSTFSLIQANRDDLGDDDFSNDQVLSLIHI